jgi:hypothetical protein
MTKPRPVKSIEDALVSIMRQVEGGYATMGALFDIEGDMVRAWGDPNRRENMPVKAIVPLDVLYQEHGGIGSPLFELLEYQRDEARAARFAFERELADTTIDLAREAGQAVAALIEASQPGATDEARARARKEVADVDAIISRVAPQLAPDREAPP